MARPTARGSAADRILTLLTQRYPITEREIALALALRPDVLRRELQKLRAAGLVVLEELDGTRFVALSGQRALRQLPQPPARDADDPAFR